MNESDGHLDTRSNEMELLTVFVDDQLFGINVDKVQSIQQFDPELVTSLPETQPGVAGMFLYRDKTIPLLDLSEILDIELKQNFDQEIIVVTEFNKVINSFKAQGVKRIYRLSWKDFVPLDQLFEDNLFFTGSVHVDDTQVLVLDLEHMLGNIFPEIIIEEVSQENIDQRNTISRHQLEIVFVEDSATMRKAAIKRLQKAGFENIKDFINGEHALKYLKNSMKENKGGALNQKVLISDIDMPIMDGLTLCQQVKLDPDLKDIYVVMYSSLINDQMITKCQKVKADTYISKPEINKLIKILDKRC